MQRTGQFLGATGYLVLLAWLGSLATGKPFWLVLIFVLVGALATTGIALWWLLRWALRDDARPRQFGLASLLLLTGFAALYFAVVRWLVVSAAPADGEPTVGRFLLIGLLCLLPALLAVPFMAQLADSLVWLAVWVVRRPWVQARLRRR